jgi:ribosomal protein S18 acetylase RimI-like enzyme
MTAVDYEALRAAIARRAARVEGRALEPSDLDTIAWSGSPSHLDNVAIQLQRVDTGEVVYLVLRAVGHPVSKGGIDFAKEPGAGTVYQLATHALLEGLGLATRLIQELESRAVERGVRQFRLGVELDNVRARQLYEHLGYREIGESEAAWEAETEDGSRYLYKTAITEMAKLTT